MNIEIKKKLNNDKGASIIMALFLLMICTVIGAIILTAATANFGKNINADDREQAYLDVRSAVWMMRDLCVGSFFMHIEQRIETSTISKYGEAFQNTEEHPTVYKNDVVSLYFDKKDKDTAVTAASVDELLKEMARKISNDNSLAPLTESLELSSSDDFNKIIVAVTMQVNYNISMAFNRESGTDYPMTLSFGAIVSSLGTQTKTIKEPENPPIGGNQEVTKVFSTCSKIEWKAYLITKGAASI